MQTAESAMCLRGRPPSFEASVARGRRRWKTHAERGRRARSREPERPIIVNVMGKTFNVCCRRADHRNGQQRRRLYCRLSSPCEPVAGARAQRRPVSRPARAEPTLKARSHHLLLLLFSLCSAFVAPVLRSSAIGISSVANVRRASARAVDHLDWQRESSCLSLRSEKNKADR